MSQKSTWSYSNLESTRRPVLHYEELPVPKFSNLTDISIKYDEFHKEV